MPNDPDMPDLNPRVLEKIQADAANTRADLAALRVDVKEGFAETRAEIVELRADTNARFKEVETQFVQLRMAMNNGFAALFSHMQDAANKLDRRLSETNELLRAMTKIDDHRELEARVRTIEDHLGLPHGAG